MKNFKTDLRLYEPSTLQTYFHVQRVFEYHSKKRVWSRICKSYSNSPPSNEKDPALIWLKIVCKSIQLWQHPYARIVPKTLLYHLTRENTRSQKPANHPLWFFSCRSHQANIPYQSQKNDWNYINTYNNQQSTKNH